MTRRPLGRYVRNRDTEPEPYTAEDQSSVAVSDNPSPRGCGGGAGTTQVMEQDIYKAYVKWSIETFSDVRSGETLLSEHDVDYRAFKAGWEARERIGGF